MTDTELITKSVAVIKSRITKGGLCGDVGCALVAGNGKVYLGICASVGSNTFCAEANAIGTMITDGEYSIKKIVATWKDEQGNVFVIPPCGNCRQLMREVDQDNLENTEVILDYNKTVQLKELIPYYDWWRKQESKN